MPNITNPIDWRFFAVGVALLVFAIALATYAFIRGTLTRDQRFILLWILPLSSGFSAGAFSGSISTSGEGVIPGLLISATGGFAVWLLTYFLLPKAPPPDVAPPADPYHISIPRGLTFKQVVDMIARQDKALAEFVGFTADELAAPLNATELHVGTPYDALLYLRLLASPERIREYEVKFDRPVYRLTARS